MKTVFVFNMRFDFRYMEYSGYDMSLVKYYDVAIGVWLADTNKKMPGLKWAAGHFLGWIWLRSILYKGEKPMNKKQEFKHN